MRSSRPVHINGKSQLHAGADLDGRAGTESGPGQALLAATAAIARELSEMIDLEAAMHAVLPRIGAAADALGVKLMRLDTESDGGPSLVTSCEWLAPGIKPKAPLPVPFRCSERDFPELFMAMRTGRSLQVDDVTLEAPPPGAEQEYAPTSRRILIVPLQAGPEPAGMLVLEQRDRGDDAVADELARLQDIAGIIGAVMWRNAECDARQQRKEAELMVRLEQTEARDNAMLGSLERLAGECDLSTFLTGHILSTALQQLHAICGTVIVRDVAQHEWRIIGHVRSHQIRPPPYPGSVLFGSADPFGAVHRAEDVAPWRQFDLDEAVPIEWPGMVEYHRSEGDLSLLLVPLTFGRRLVGFVVLGFKRREVLPDTHATNELLRGLARGATIAIELSRLADSSRDTAVLDERNRIGREIHDGLAQAFTGILMQLGAAESVPLPEDGLLALTLRRIRDLAREGLAEARRSVLALRPAQVRRQGFAELLEKLAKRSTIPGRVRCSFDGGEHSIALPPEHEHELLRIVQEAVSNAVRHGTPSNVRIEMSRQESDWLLAVADDGCGMPLSPLQCARLGFGLVGMRERAAAIGAALDIDSLPGEGTRVTVRLPVRSTT